MEKDQYTATTLTTIIPTRSFGFVLHITQWLTMVNTDLSTNEQRIVETKELWSTGKKVMIQVAWNLLKIRESGEWEKYGHKTFQQFAADELDIPQSQGSKLLIIGEYFLDKYTPEEIGPVAYENLYLATKTEGSVEENLARAKTWRREDFKQHKAEVAPHPFQEVSYCGFSGCGLSKANHP